MLRLNEVQQRFVKALALLSLLCVVLFLARGLSSGFRRYVYIPENLALAWLALIFSWALVRNLKVKRWLSWQNLLLSILWLVFLPNAWYVLTDFIHIPTVGEVGRVFDIILLSTLVFSGFAMGFASLFMVHREFLKRLPRIYSHGAVATILFLSSFAIYMGRYLRWNTWDIVTDPSGVILNVSDRIIDPFSYPNAFKITFLFFILLAVMYAAIWQIFSPSTRRKTPSA